MLTHCCSKFVVFTHAKYYEGLVGKMSKYLLTVTELASPISNQPTTMGMAAKSNVFLRPIKSTVKAAVKQPKMAPSFINAMTHDTSLPSNKTGDLSLFNTIEALEDQVTLIPDKNLHMKPGTNRNKFNFIHRNEHVGRR